MEKLIQDKQYFKLLAVRNRLSGMFNRKQLQTKYDEKEWLKQRITMEQINEVIVNVEGMCDTFRMNRLIYILHLCCAALSLIMLIAGIVINVKVTSDSETVKLYNFWDLSWPYFCAFFFIPMIAAGLYFVNKYSLNKYESRVSEYFADININVFEKQQVIWKIGGLCSYIDLSQVSRLRSRSREIGYQNTATALAGSSSISGLAQKMNTMNNNKEIEKNNSTRYDEENSKGVQMTELKQHSQMNDSANGKDIEEQKTEDNQISSVQQQDQLIGSHLDDAKKKEFNSLTEELAKAIQEEL